MDFISKRSRRSETFIIWRIFLLVCSNTLCFGGEIPAPSVTAKVIQDLFYKNKLACAKTVKVVKAKGVATAYAQMHSRGDAQKAMERLNETKEILGGKHVKVKITKPSVRCL